MYTMKNCKVEISANGTTWTDISSVLNSVSVEGGDRMAEDLFVFGADTASVLTGPREPLEVTVRVVYAEGTSDAFETLRAAYEAGTSYYVRWSPRGGTTGQFIFTADPGPITSFAYPAGEAGNAEPILCEITLRTSKITKSVAS